MLNFSMPRILLCPAVCLILVSLLAAQSTKTADIKTVTNAGRITGEQYENSYFGVTVRVPQPNEHLALNALVAENRAILLEAVHSQGDMAQRHNFVIVAHSANIPGLTSTTQFVRSVRHQLEREGFETVKAELPVMIAGHEFIQSDLRMKDNSHWKSILVTPIKGYMFGFWMEAANKEQLDAATKLDGRISFK